MVELPTLGPGDERRLEAWLAPRTATSLFLRSNARAAGLRDEGRELQGTYVAAVVDGALVGVAAHYWNGMLILSAERAVAALARAAVERSGRALQGFLGPWDQVVAARAALGLADRPAALEQREALFTLDLARLVVPPRLEAGAVRVRRTRDDELEGLVAWRTDYEIEALGGERGPALEARSRVVLDRLQRRGAQYVLEDDGRVVAYTAFTAELPDWVQVGGVWTPPALRGRGHARAAVAGSLLDARARGVTSSVLFTGEHNVAARRAYLALGYERVGDYGIVVLR